MDVGNLLSSVEKYKNQLEQVGMALEVAGEEEKKELQELQLNIIQVLELTLHQLDEQQKSESHQNDTITELEEGTSNLDDEFELFKAEIEELSKDEAEIVEKDKIEEEKMLSELKILEGKEVRVPFTERWGGYSYHNAVILKLVLKENNMPDFNNPEVVVLYNQPTSPSMLSCKFFLNGHCKFDEEKCKFSHGKIVSVSDIKPYQEPVYDSITSGSKVLCLHDKDIWHKGEIEDILSDRSSLSFNCSVCRGVFEANLNHVIPICADEDCEQETFSKDVDENSIGVEEDIETVFTPSTKWLEGSLSYKMGEWEKHTKGIGSKLMMKMGYLAGTGLGPKGEGMVNPVTTLVYPQGVSLDRCMELRLSSKGEGLLEVEKRLKRIQKKEEEKQKKNQEFLSQNTSVFDIINKKLDGSSTSSDSPDYGDKQKMDISKNSLRKNSTKELNKKNLELGRHILQLEKDISRLKQSKERQAKDTSTLKVLDGKLTEKMNQLKSLREAEGKVLKEQSDRKSAKKIYVF